jgi:hypothetical protein
MKYVEFSKTVMHGSHVFKVKVTVGEKEEKDELKKVEELRIDLFDNSNKFLYTYSTETDSLDENRYIKEVVNAIDVYKRHKSKASIKLEEWDGIINV